MSQRTSSERLLQPILLTAAALAIGVAVAIAWGAVGIAMYALTLPVPLFLLWASWDVPTLDDRYGEPEPRALARPVTKPTSPPKVAEAT